MSKKWWIYLIICIVLAVISGICGFPYDANDPTWLPNETNVLFGQGSLSWESCKWRVTQGRRARAFFVDKTTGETIILYGTFWQKEGEQCFISGK